MMQDFTFLPFRYNEKRQQAVYYEYLSTGDQNYIAKLKNLGVVGHKKTIKNTRGISKTIIFIAIIAVLTC